RPGHLQGPECSQLGIRVIAINGQGDKGLVESGLDCLVRNGALDQGAARASSLPAVFDEHLLLRDLRVSQPFGEGGIPLHRPKIVEVRMGSRSARHDSGFSLFTCNMSLASGSEGTGSGCESTPSRPKIARPNRAGSAFRNRQWRTLPEAADHQARSKPGHFVLMRCDLACS